MMNAIGLSITQTRGSLAWTPASLPGLALWLTAGPSWCFTDAAGTVPCADGDPVYVWRDRSGNANDAIQATSGMRPTLRAGPNGVWYVTFDGVDDVLEVAPSATVRITGPLTVSAWLKTAGTNASNLLGRAGVGASNIGSGVWMLRGRAGGVSLAMDAASAAGVQSETAPGATINNNVGHCIAGVYTPSTSLQTWRDGVGDTALTSSIPASLFDSATQAVEIMGNRVGSIDAVLMWGASVNSVGLAAINTYTQGLHP